MSDPVNTVYEISSIDIALSSSHIGSAMSLVRNDRVAIGPGSLLKMSILLDTYHVIMNKLFTDEPGLAHLRGASRYLDVLLYRLNTSFSMLGGKYVKCAGSVVLLIDGKEHLRITPDRSKVDELYVLRWHADSTQEYYSMLRYLETILNKLREEARLK